MSVLRPCLGPGSGLDCPADEYVIRGRCGDCAQAWNRRRGSTSERGYGSEHQRAREALRASLPAYCAYGCGTWLLPDGDWVAAHRVDGDPASPRVAACRRCNERAKLRA